MAHNMTNKKTKASLLLFQRQKNECRKQESKTTFHPFGGFITPRGSVGNREKAGCGGGASNFFRLSDDNAKPNLGTPSVFSANSKRPAFETHLHTKIYSWRNDSIFYFLVSHPPCAEKALLPSP